MKLPLYVHIPFCRQKCRYCAFFSRPYQKDLAEALVFVYLQQLENFRRQGFFFNCVYVGGGTPSLLGLEILKKLLPALAKDEPQEFSWEANPESLSKEKLKILKDFGVNRLSIGVQSFSERNLKSLGRAHTKQQAITAIEEAGRCGFNNLNIDLIYSLPQQTIAEWEKDLSQALDFNLQHISLYSLIYEKQTPFGRLLKAKKIKKTPAEYEAQMYLKAKEFLKSKGFLRYEVSNFAKVGFACRHNINYWQDYPYLALGPAAVYFYQGIRKRYVSDVGKYIEYFRGGQDMFEFKEEIKGEQYAREKAAFNIRMAAGINFAEFKKTTGFDFSRLFSHEVASLEEKGLIQRQRDCLKLTDSGFLFADYASRQFV